MIILDTSVLVEIERKNTQIINTLKKRDKAPIVCLTSVVLAEFLTGCLKIGKKVPKTIDLYPVIPFDGACARKFSQIKHELEQDGSMIPLFDLMTAACALQHNATLLTMDHHFDNIKDLSVEFFE